MSEATIGLDVGTTLTKAVAFDDDGQVLAEVSRPTEVTRLPGNKYEQDTEQVVNSVHEVLAELSGKLGSAVAEVGVTAQGDGLWLVDHGGRAVRPAISWLDGRAHDIVDEWEAAGLLERIFRANGSLIFPGASGPILAWLSRHEPDSLAKAHTAAYCKDVVLQRLTGIRATDLSDASVPWKELTGSQYSSELLRACGLEEYSRLLAPIEAAPKGQLTNSAALQTGLRPGTPVVAAPYDLVASALGANVSDVGDGLLIVGTTLACQVLTDSIDTAGEPGGLSLSTPTPNRWLRAMPAMVGAAALDWAMQMTGQGVDTLEHHLAISGIGANGVRVLPFLAEAGERAPFKDRLAAGQIDGVRLGTTDSDILRAFCEAIAFSARHCFDAAGLTGSVFATGGGVTSPSWRQIFADVLGHPIATASGAQIGARGAAAIARQATGKPEFGPLEITITEPDQDVSDRYEDLYQMYLRRVETARENWKSHA